MNENIPAFRHVFLSSSIKLPACRVPHHFAFAVVMLQCCIDPPPPSPLHPFSPIPSIPFILQCMQWFLHFCVCNNHCCGNIVLLFQPEHAHCPKAPCIQAPLSRCCCTWLEQQPLFTSDDESNECVLKPTSSFSLIIAEMEACIRRAGARAAGLLQDAAREHAEFYTMLRVVLRGQGQSGSSGIVIHTSPPASPPHPPPPKAGAPTFAASDSDDGDLFSRDGGSSGSSTGSSVDIDCAFNLSLDDNTCSSDADLLVAFSRACPLASSSWRSEAAAHAPMLLQRMCVRTHELADASCSNNSSRGAVAAAAYASHMARVYLAVLPHMPPSPPPHHRALVRGHGGGGGGWADDEDVHRGRFFSGAVLHDEHAHRRHHNEHHVQPQLQQPFAAALRAAWLHVWRRCR